MRVVVLNYNGDPYVMRCLSCLESTDYPAESLEVVVVDNASTDGSDRLIATHFPGVRLIRSPRNVGFPANNLAMRDLEGIDHVALVNNDAFVEPGWLQPLVDELEADPGLGAACSKIVFAATFAEVDLTVDPVHPAAGRAVVRVSGAELDGVDAWHLLQLVDGFSPPRYGDRREPVFVQTLDHGVIRVPIDDEQMQRNIRLRLSATPAVDVVLGSSGERRRVCLEPAPRWTTIAVEGPGSTIVQNAGSRLVRTAYAGDRGFMHRDGGVYDERADVFAWCGGGVLLRREYLQDVGLLDERFFLYYEDTDLSWRGRLAGWNYRFVPASVIRHLHSASTGEGSPIFQHYVERNRLAMLTKNAPARLACSSVYYYVRMLGGYTWRALYRALRGQPAGFGVPARRLLSLLDYLRLLPGLLVDRRRIRSHRVVSDGEILGWMVAE